MKNKLTAALAAMMLAGGAVFGISSAAAATEEVCVPSEAIAAYDEVVTVSEAYDETVVDEEAHFLRYSWTGGPVEEGTEPPFPDEAWQSNTPGDRHNIGYSGAYFQSHGESGGGDWFYLEWFEGSSHVVHHEAVTETIHHEAVPAVVCEEEPVEVTPVACSAAGDWYTEGDDAEPTLTNDGLLFTGGTGSAVGYRIPASGNLQGWDSVSYDASGSTGLFYFRIVVDASADGGAGYSSLTVTSGSPVTSDSVAYSNKLGASHTIAEFAEIWPNAVITSVGFHLDSGASAEEEVLLASASGPCVSADWTTDVVIPPTEEPEPPVETPVVVVPAPIIPAEVAAVPVTAELASTGVDATGMISAAVAGLGLLAFGVAGVLFRRRLNAKEPQHKA